MKIIINEFDKITRWPKKKSDKDIVIKWLSNKFRFNIIYTEKEINSIIKTHHVFDDVALLRRELISQKYLQRKCNGSQYWKK